ncbi:MAG: hypothetical protein IJL98_03205, partial [Lachnospiraceae bacterium]|nr:hypothetical protein [Lachnospiraceae bacterium]
NELKYKIVGMDKYHNQSSHEILVHCDVLRNMKVNEMLKKTSTKNAPWYIIESNDKKYARIKTLKILVKALEEVCRNNLA